MKIKNHLKRLLKPTIHPIEKGVFLKTHLIFFGIGFALFLFFHSVPLEFYSFKEIAIEDIDFSDLYYQNQDTLSKSDSAKTSNIIIINSGSLKNEEGYGRRREMIQLIRALTDSSYCQPKKIGVDLEYDVERDTKTDKELENLFIEKQCVVAESKQNKTIFKKLQTYNVNFPDEENKTVRMYYNYNRIHGDTIKNTFANGCLDRDYDTIKEEEFHLKYYCKGKGFYNVFDKNEEEKVFAFPAIEADTILKGMSKEDRIKFFHNKIVLIGHLGEGIEKMNNVDDMTDKHQSPTGLEFIFKEKIMPGVVIHANAIKQLQLGEKMHCINGFKYFVLLYFITGYFFLIFILIENLKNVYVQIVVEITVMIASIIFINYLSIKLMGLSYHLNTVYIGIAMIFLIELKSFFVESYHEKAKHKRQQQKHINNE
ncbi:CHASE2 domain-containing protein [Flavobacterium sp.]|uniref:CHASE2 domain-containing protein n=1 Tax=Flavobacterium sp. TaxID=239 RepID=UPI00333FA22F